jgi:NAD(P)-dependent dehydrogenase (short-subunit alcohol dehydrogenase family)
LKEHEWDAVLAANLKAPFLLVHETAPAMMQRAGAG